MQKSTVGIHQGKSIKLYPCNRDFKGQFSQKCNLLLSAHPHFAPKPDFFMSWSQSTFTFIVWIKLHENSHFILPESHTRKVIREWWQKCYFWVNCLMHKTDVQQWVWCIFKNLLSLADENSGWVDHVIDGRVLCRCECLWFCNWRDGWVTATEMLDSGLRCSSSLFFSCIPPI